MNEQDPQKATLFFVHEGKLVGPFTVGEVLEKIHDGQLGISTRVFDSSKDAWVTAADVVPALDLRNVASWQPPSRPPDLNNIHVVGLNKQRTEGIDYFMLISDRKKELEREKEFAKERERKQIKSPYPSSNWAFPKTMARTVAGEITRTLKKILKKSPPLADEHSQAADVIPFVSRIKDFAQENKKEFTIAAGLALVFGGTYSVVKGLNGDSQRGPAASSAVSADGISSSNAQKKGSGAMDAKPRSYEPEKAEEVGKGSLPSNRASGSAGAKKKTTVENQIAPAAPPTPTPSLTPAPTPGEASTYSPYPNDNADNAQNAYPISDDTRNAPGDIPPVPLNVPPVATLNQENYDPNAAQTPQNDDYNRYPTSESPAVEEVVPANP